MILIIGGAGQGKLDYVLQKTGYGPAQVARTPEEARTRPVFAGLEDWPELDEAALLEANPDVILICDEVGCGVVPMEKKERDWRGLDVPRLPQGEELARRVGATLPAVEHIYRSPLQRCRRTAELLWPGVEMTVVDELRESDFGPFEGKNHEELKDDPLYQAWLGMGDRPNFAAMPVGESAQQVTDRVSIGLEKTAADAARRGFGRVGVVSHGRALMALLAKYGRPERDYYGWMCPNCGGFRAELNPDTLELTILEEYRGEKGL